MIIDSIFMWLVAVPLTFLAAYVFKLPPIWIYFIMTLDEFEKNAGGIHSLFQRQNGLQILQEILSDHDHQKEATLFTTAQPPF